MKTKITTNTICGVGIGVGVGVSGSSSSVGGGAGGRILSNVFGKMKIIRMSKSSLTITTSPPPPTAAAAAAAAAAAKTKTNISFSLSSPSHSPVPFPSFPSYYKKRVKTRTMMAMTKTNNNIMSVGQKKYETPYYFPHHQKCHVHCVNKRWYSASLPVASSSSSNSPSSSSSTSSSSSSLSRKAAMALARPNNSSVESNHSLGHSNMLESTNDVGKEDLSLVSSSSLLSEGMDDSSTTKKNKRKKNLSSSSSSSSSSRTVQSRPSLMASSMEYGEKKEGEEDEMNNHKNKMSDEKDNTMKNEKEIITEEQERERQQQQHQRQQQQQQHQQFPQAMMALHEFMPRIVVIGVGGAGGNAVNNMIAKSMTGVDFLAVNTDAQHLSTTLTDNRLQIGTSITGGLGCGANPDAGRLAAEENRNEIHEFVNDAHMVFITAGMGGGTGTGAAPVIADLCYELGILTVGVVTKPFAFEGTHRMRLAKEGIERLQNVVDTLLVIPNQNLFRLINRQTSFVESFQLADDVLFSGVKGITDLMTSPGLINLDFADVQSVMHGMGNAMLGTGQSSSSSSSSSSSPKSKRGRDSNKNRKNYNDSTYDDEEEEDEFVEGMEECNRAIEAAERALQNPLLGDMDISTAKGMLVNISGGSDMTLWEVDRAAQQITSKVKDENANIIFGSAFDASLEGSIRVSVVATGLDDEDKEEYEKEHKNEDKKKKRGDNIERR